MYKRHDGAPFSPKSRRTNYGERQMGGENEKDKRVGENRRVERGKKEYRGNKVNPMVGESSGFQASVYYHMI